MDSLWRPRKLDTIEKIWKRKTESNTSLLQLDVTFEGNGRGSRQDIHFAAAQGIKTGVRVELYEFHVLLELSIK